MSENKSQTPLQQQYNAAPRLASPTHVDRQVMEAARAATVGDAGRKKRLRGVGMSLPALAAMCVVAVGVGVIYQADNPQSNARDTDITHGTSVAESASEGVSIADTGVAADSTRNLVVTEAGVAEGQKDRIAQSSVSSDDTDAIGLSASRESLSANSSMADEAQTLSAESADAAFSTNITLAEPAKSSELPMAETIPNAKELNRATTARKSVSAPAAQSERAALADIGSGNRWLHTRDPENFIIRIASAETTVELQQMVVPAGLPVESVRLQADRWVLVHGSFSTMSDARAALENIDDKGADVAIVRIGELQTLAVNNGY